MVATFLQGELAKELKRILSGYRLKNSQGVESDINVFEQLLPVPVSIGQEELAPELLENGLVDDLTAPNTYPYIIVRIVDGEIENADSAQAVNINLLIGVYEPDYDKQGHKDILTIIARIYERFAKEPVLNGRYILQYPVLWSLQEEESHPFYFGGVSLTFEAATVRREDKYA